MKASMIANLIANFVLVPVLLLVLPGHMEVIFTDINTEVGGTLHELKGLLVNKGGYCSWGNSSL
jgi:hypothetical protein